MSRDAQTLSERATQTPEHVRAVLAESVTAYADQLADVIGGFFLRAGVDPEVGAAALERAARRVRSGEASLHVPEQEVWVQLSDAVMMWWRDPHYVDEAGRPRPLPDVGPAPSLEALFEQTVAESLRAAARELLRRRAAIERDGTWHFVDEQNTLRLGQKEGVHRLLTGIAGWLRTYLHNQTRIGELPHLMRFDAAAHVSNFPQALVPELCTKLYKRMRVVLEEFEGWMAQVVRDGHPGPTTRVSLAAFLHTSEPLPGDPAAAPPTAAQGSDAAVHSEETARGR
jgi:hypothetical protein